MKPEKTAILTLCLGLALAGTALAQSAPQTAAATPPATNPAAKKAKAVAIDPTFDAGVVAKGDQIVHDFLIKNDGTAALEIQRVEPGCGCTVAQFDKTVAPGATGKVHAVVDTSTFTGPISKGVTVYTSDSDVPRIQLTIQAKIEPYIQVKPGYARYISVQGESKEGTITQSLWTPDGSDFAIEKVVSPFPYLKASFREAKTEERQKDAKGKQWQVDITLDNFAAPVGSIADYVTVYTTHPKQKLVQIPVSGFVRPVLAVTPPAGDFGSVEVKEPIKKTLNVRNFATEDIKITSLDNSMEGKGMAAAFQSVQEGREYMLQVTLDPKIQKGPFDAKLVLHTDSAKVPKIEITIKGTVL
ncbi:MAG TPA: DUF1573 domain-containing protein [Thermoanaerobaculia bacterium]|nr:DUF1573 domain-containing protein [Thermoanaerobaculia bacterium]